MISIIICSRQPDISYKLRQNIEQTIGVDYEIITIDNSLKKYSISKAYNEGVDKSRYPILCFMHDDVHFYSDNWGVSCLRKFDNQKIGAIGLAGSAYAPIFPGPWWKTGFNCQHLFNRKDITYGNGSENQMPILVLDGFWMCIRKQLFEQIKYDEEQFNGFHFYDIDICMQIQLLGHSIISVYDIDVAHHSNGKLNREWQKFALRFCCKWRKSLPATVINVSFLDKIKSEFTTLFDYLRIVVKNG
jgi:hypothetical protein